MIKDLPEIESILKERLNHHKGVLKFRQVNDHYEASGTITAMQGKKQVDGIYFGSVVPKPKDIRFYFFPLYTHKDQIDQIISEPLKKQLKGKTCFHIKKLDDDMINEIEAMIEKGVALFQQDNLLAEA